MSVCPVCSCEVVEPNRYCGRCGSALDGDSSAPTRTSAPPASAGGRKKTPWSSSADAADGRFLPGTVLAGRYRIAGLLGRGGMGEVYRADDLKLGQPVALKFLPEELDRHEERLARFLAEVRMARQVSHPNVCRVHDVGEHEGQHYLSMEYVDGEDLASLLRRIGRLPHDKAVQTARQICAGLAAAHVRGIVHRDLKPANIMIDGRGQVRITDFGLAGLAEGFQGAEIRAGTPDYMAPEQLAGREVNASSDIYALGLVLYELFTGRRAFKAGSPAELLRMRESTPPVSPSSVVEALDPSVERVILRCLDSDPAGRPHSAPAVAAALPGGDPLAAALAAGETPSPEMVAQAGAEGGLRPGLATLCLVLTFVAAALALTLAGGLRLVGHFPRAKPPDVLAVEAQQTLRRLGHDAAAADRAFGYVVDTDRLSDIERNDSSGERWDDLGDSRPAALQFWYRESPVPLVPAGLRASVTETNPPMAREGMVRLRMDAEGRLTGLLAVPPEFDESPAPPVEPDWSVLFEAAGLDPAAFRGVPPAWNPLVDCDLRAAWEGSYANRPELPIRIETGAYRGRPVYFRVVAPWTKPEAAEDEEADPGHTAALAVILPGLLAVLTCAMLLARRNLRLGRGDRRGAFRIALYLFLVMLVGWALTAHHVAALSELGRLFMAVLPALFVACLGWILYVALEPYARRLWPHVLISWTRLLSGRLRDPLVGRDILVGHLAGAVLAAISAFSALVQVWIGRPPEQPSADGLSSLNGFGESLGQLIEIQPSATFNAIVLLFLIVLLRMLFRKPWVAVGGTLAIAVGVGALGAGGDPWEVVFFALVNGIVLTVLLRVGLLASILSFFFAMLILHLPLTNDLSAWYAPWALGVLSLGFALTIYGYVVSLAGRPLLKDVLDGG
jgi:serine/threonine-protein kinase